MLSPNDCICCPRCAGDSPRFLSAWATPAGAALPSRAGSGPTRHAGSSRPSGEPSSSTHIPGSPTTLYCAGARVIAQYRVTVLIEGLGLGLTLLSYEDGLDFGFTADRELMPDVCYLMPEMQAELEALAKEFGVANA